MSDHERLTRALQPLYRLERERAADPLGRCWDAIAGDGTAAMLLVLAPTLAARLTNVDGFVSALERSGHVAQPALLALLGAGVTDDGDVYVAWQRPGVPAARARVGAQAPMKAADLAAVGAALCDALVLVHAAGEVHGGISPDRVFPDGAASRLGGLGLFDALVAGGISRFEAVRAAETTPYASPEQSAGEAMDARSDVYTLGAVLYELLTGKPPFGGRTTSFVIATVLADEPAPEATGSRLTESILRAIEKAPDDRWGSAAAFARALRSEKESSGRATAIPERSTGTPIRHGCLPMALIFVVAGAIAALI